MIILGSKSSFILTAHSTALVDGLPILINSEPYNFGQDQSIFSMMPPSLVYRYNLHRIQTEAVATIMRTVDLQNLGTSSSLNMLVDVFDKQLQEIVVEQPTKLGKFTAVAKTIISYAFTLLTRNRKQTS